MARGGDVPAGPGRGAIEGQHTPGEIFPDHGIGLCGDAITAPARRQDGSTGAQFGLGDGGEVEIC